MYTYQTVLNPLLYNLLCVPVICPFHILLDLHKRCINTLLKNIPWIILIDFCVDVIFHTYWTTGSGRFFWTLVSVPRLSILMPIVSFLGTFLLVVFSQYPHDNPQFNHSCFLQLLFFSPTPK